MLIAPERADRWYDFRFIQADQAKDVPGLREIADRVTFGGLAPNTPVLYAYRRTDAPYPDAVIGLPVDHATVVDVRNRDADTILGLLDALEDAFGQWFSQVVAGRGN